LKPIARVENRVGGHILVRPIDHVAAPAEVRDLGDTAKAVDAVRAVERDPEVRAVVIEDVERTLVDDRPLAAVVIRIADRPP
jgi:HD-like signal output (HDOD) protein